MLNRTFAGAIAIPTLLVVAACSNTSSGAGSSSPTPTVNSGSQVSTAGQPESARPRNVIVFLGDGMGVSTVTAARIYAGQKLGLAGEEHSLSFEKFPHVALVKTYNTDMQVPDSAGTMTAIVTGEKTRAGVLSIGASAPRGDCAAALANPLPTLLEQAEDLGLATGLVSTTRITHATPAANYAHSADRNWEDDTALGEAGLAAGCRDIARQLVELDAGDGVDVIFGGGRANFYPKGWMDPEYKKPLGRRSDATDLVAQWLAAAPNRAYAWDSKGFAGLSQDAQQVLALFEPSHMQWEANRAKDIAGEPSLAAMTKVAIERLSARSDKGYYLVVEGGRIDHGHHAGNAYLALEDTLAFDAAVQQALQQVDLNDTLILVTADHSHTLTISGYPQRGNPILGKVRLPNGELLPDVNGHPYTTLGYANGPGYQQNLTDLTEIDTQDAGYQQRATVPLSIETHAGEDVGAYAIGAGADALHGVIEQNLLYDLLKPVLAR